MASQAVEYRRTMSLEPMSPADRRIIHLELRDHDGVRTESVGEGDRRKVTIIPRTPSDD
jgi:spoIIIJ-associated protein